VVTEPLWPAPVERVAAFLRASGAEARLEEFAAEGATAEGAAGAIGCSLGQIVKSLVVLCDDEAWLVLVAGDRRGDTRKVARATGARRARIARPDEVVAVTGFEPGAVAPFPLARVKGVLVDESLLAQRVVWVGGGSPRHLVALAPAELLRLTRGRSLDVAQDDRA
jgi:prolyl-tRNA editing enzyme YbaK/EbsC (Cys-tRNA(Pro) deacylase)